ncbi:hypothetical protein ACFO5X_25845 [Seohaeicola nanhaiensis]|uniref:DUF3618 domain-containing protein n=1 Tax=Seohaeicola nanhaiensis TaxID=1387282 RepID=A0ABV9KP81_9RHOB
MNTQTQTTQPRIKLSVSEAERPATEAARPDPAAQPQGLSGFARQGDLVELHRRIGEKFAKLPQELAEQIREPPVAVTGGLKQIDTRLEALAASLDGLEGALRIELAPYLGKAVSAAVRESAGRRPGRWRGLWLGLGLIGGVAIGTVWHAAIERQAAGVQARVSPYLASFTGR